MKPDNRQETLYFIGGLFPREREEDIRRLTKTGLQSAANNLQWKFVRGYDSCLGTENVHLINSEYIGSFPRRYSGLVVPRYGFRHAESATGDVGAGFVNLPVLKEFSRASRLCSEIDKIRLEADGRLYFVGYAATYPMVKALLYAKRRFPDCVTCLIVPDLPQYMELGRKGAGPLRRVKNNLVNREMGMMDCYIPLTAAMAPYLGTDLSHCVVVGGIADDPAPAPAPAVAADLPGRYILYTGTLQYRYGIGELLAAFKGLDADGIGLVICGDGEAAGEVKALQGENSRVRYLGVLPAEEVAALREGASVLVNPRRNNGEYTRFSFPSKMMEYLASGVPTVAYKLDGMPDDYDGLFVDATDGGLKAAIGRVLSMDPGDSAEIASRARSYVLEHKGAAEQCSRTLELLRKEAESNER